MLKVWGVKTNRTLRVHWALAELGLDYECVPIEARSGETREPRYRRLNPKQKIPCLEDGDLVLSESAAIVRYLFDRFATGSVFVPADAVERAREDEWCYTVMTELDAHSLYVIRRHDDLRHIYGAAPQAVEAAREYFDRLAGAVAEKLAPGASFVLGNRLSAADILLTTCLGWALRYSLDLPGALLHYHDRLTARDAYRAAAARNRGAPAAARTGA